MKPKLVILTGPPGAGKSTVGKILAEKIPNSAIVSTDTLRDFIKNGYISPKKDTKKVQLKLGAENSCILAKNFLKKKFNVFLDDVICARWIMNFYLKKLKKQKPIFILLLPKKETLQKRDLERGENAMKERAMYLHDKFSEFLKEEKRFIILDTSNQTKEETANKIMEIIK